MTDNAAVRPDKPFCSACGQPVTCRIPEGDNRLRCICTACGTVHYENPKILVSVMLQVGDRLLWVRRAHAPRAGYWFIPSGFMEQGESLQEAGVRELAEETGLQLAADALQLYAIGSLVHVNEVYVAFRASMSGTPACRPGAEVAEIGLFREHELPWEALAFPSVIPQVRTFYQEMRRCRFGVYLGEYREQDSRIQPMGLAP